MDRILVFPHIGTAWGHFIRTAEYINNTDFDSGVEIFMIVPKNVYPCVKRFIPSKVSVLLRDKQVTVNNPTGEILIEGFSEYFREDEILFNKIQPSLIISDPGIQGAILHHKFKVPWINISHGCYRDIPHINDPIIDELAKKTWETIGYSLDKLIKMGTGDASLSWQKLKVTAFKEELLSGTMKKHGWETGEKKAKLLITCGSADEVQPSSAFLDRLKNFFPNIVVAGSSMKGYREGISFIGNTTNYQSIIDSNTIVLTHGGFGTLKAVAHAGRVVTTPTDLDQLCNSIISFVENKSEFVFDRNWFEALDNKPYCRSFCWDNVSISRKDERIIFTGVPQYSIENH
ncbi:hypothetical protein JFY67_01510 [Porphyromonas gingivalis]|uniref:hypothetical protein n=1 Tax=Porphyromonas gingivalis TaxID=837 RepID=UPI0007729675|nr:hypothetical protein [Porphyromonas gingivalis]KXC08889.1 hypothetical protein AT291_05475 [Porphyromonas gingivalis]MCE8174138.1 hypothetical protein [Porphyromonas gingivalis]